MNTSLHQGQYGAVEIHVVLFFVFLYLKLLLTLLNGPNCFISCT